MDIVQKALGDISGGRVLDVATGVGRFADTLAGGLKDFVEIIAVDLQDRPPEQAAEVFATERISYQRMDATSLDFPEDAFDTVAIGQSLHHMPDIDLALSEMLRVLKPGGHLVVSEMYRDGLNDSQMTHVLLHDWLGEIDTALSVTHNPTFKRDEILELLRSLGLGETQVYDYGDLGSDPKDPERIAELERVIEAYVKKAEDLEDAQIFASRGREICRRLHGVGFQPATRILFLGRKEAAERAAQVPRDIPVEDA